MAAGCEVGSAQPPSRDEYHAAVSEATQILEDTVNEVNEILEELRYVVEEDN